MTFYAHSGRAAYDGRPAVAPQLYADHVQEVIHRAIANAQEAAQYLADASQRTPFITSVFRAAESHDLGKLLPENAEVLARTYGKDRPHRLPVNHVDTGVARLLKDNDMLSALLAWSHHIGLDDKSSIVRTHPPLRDATICKQVDQALPQCLADHKDAFETALPEVAGQGFTPGSSLDFRIALSCLVDADHGDTASLYGNESLPDSCPTLRASERLAALDAYVADLSKSGPNTTRNAIRAEVYESTRHADTTPGIRACGSPVGTGKTTSVMAHLLNVAAANGLRRIFVVLPFTNIIDQAVDVYRKALVLEGEDPEAVVAAHHHRAEFDSLESRSLTYLWRAPIVVVTAVQFFETIAAASTASLRKLHSLPGAAIFVDEAHAAMPADLWLPAWTWVRTSCERWSCHWVLASGSLTRFWELDDFREAEQTHGLSQTKVTELVGDAARTKAAEAEDRRINFATIPDAIGIDELAVRICMEPGPRIAVMNTVRGAALLAQRLATLHGRYAVEHLSTSLCPRDRALTVKRVKQRLATNETNWFLIATSCVEAGVDFSFRTGFRERFGLCNLLQLGGRVCREAETEGTVYDFTLRADELHPHPGANYPARALATLFTDNMVGPEHCREALRREIIANTERGTSRGHKICNLDSAFEFRTVQKLFRMIDSNTITVVIDTKAIDKLHSGYPLPPQELQSVSVQIWASRLDKEPVLPLGGWPGLYAWNGVYNTFVGYLADWCANPKRP